jgi:hypothetical protein
LEQRANAAGGGGRFDERIAPLPRFCPAGERMKVLLVALLNSLLILSSFGVEKADFLPVAKAMMAFPQEPTESSFRSIESKMAALPKLLGDKDERHIKLLCAAFLAAGHQRHGWTISENNQFAQMALEIISGKGQTATYVGDDTAIDTSKFDIWWMSYLGSQDDKYLHKLLKFAGSSRQGDDPAGAALVETATWSFKSNCQHMSGVKEFAQRCLNDPQYKDKAEFLRSCIDPK